MDDLEMTRLCAEAMGYTHQEALELDWAPLRDDAQAMALHKRFLLDTIYAGHQYTVYVWKPNTRMRERVRATNTDLNRAIVECVAKMQENKVVKEVANG